MAMIVGMQYRPVLDLDFGRMKSLTAVVGPTPSYTRASTGTYFNSAGVLTTAAINGPRFDHVYNGVSWVSKGLLIEEARTNLLQYSHRLLTAPWYGIAMTITESSGIAPDGANAASKVVPTTANQAHYVHQNITAAAAVYSQSFFAKSSGYDFVQICDGFPGGYYANFNLAIGTVATNSGYTTATIDILGNGWYRCSVKSTLSNNTAEACRLIPMPSNIASRVPSFAGDGTSGILVWNAQVELGSFPTSPIPTTTAQLTRSADVCQITGSDFTSFWNASEGSVVAEFDYNDISYGSGPYRIGNAPSGTWSYTNSRSNATTMFLEGYSNGSTPVYFTITPILSANKTAFGYKTNDFALSTNGASVQTDTSGATVLNIANFYIGSPADSYLNGHIARLRYYNTRLPNAILRFFSGGSGAFQPDNISGLQFWVDASDTTTLYTDSALTTLAINDGDVIGGWKDKSGNSRNALQTDNTKKPLLKLAIQNGRNVIRYSGSLLSLVTASSVSFGLYSAFVVAQKNSTIRNCLLTVGDSTTMSMYFNWREGGIGFVNQYEQDASGALSNSTVYPGFSAVQYTFARDSLTSLSRLSMRINGAAPAQTISYTSVSANVTAYPITVGSFSNGIANSWDGDIAEILIYNSVLSGSDILLVEAYLKTKWGTP